MICWQAAPSQKAELHMPKGVLHPAICGLNKDILPKHLVLLYYS